MAAGTAIYVHEQAQRGAGRAFVGGKGRRGSHSRPQTDPARPACPSAVQLPGSFALGGASAAATTPAAATAAAVHSAGLKPWMNVAGEA